MGWAGTSVPERLFDGVVYTTPDKGAKDEQDWTLRNNTLERSPCIKGLWLPVRVKLLLKFFSLSYRLIPLFGENHYVKFVLPSRDFSENWKRNQVKVRVTKKEEQLRRKENPSCEKVESRSSCGGDTVAGVKGASAEMSKPCYK
ncbi:hypothetical protein RUM43_003871 [Polyplax serrata]|uniref:Uncharacterized protein n=1 Tax=Polyplax serrata TaxID=468196 RepID=A0AAN8PP30_POLSC